MDDKRVISYKRMPTRCPLVLSMVVVLFLDRFQAPGWLWGIAGTVLAILWLVWIVAFFSQEEVDVVFKEIERR